MLTHSALPLATLPCWHRYIRACTRPSPMQQILRRFATLSYMYFYQYMCIVYIELVTLQSILQLPGLSNIQAPTLIFTNWIFHFYQTLSNMLCRCYSFIVKDTKHYWGKVIIVAHYKIRNLFGLCSFKE